MYKIANLLHSRHPPSHNPFKRCPQVHFAAAIFVSVMLQDNRDVINAQYSGQKKSPILYVCHGELVRHGRRANERDRDARNACPRVRTDLFLQSAAGFRPTYEYLPGRIIDRYIITAN